MLPQVNINFKNGVLNQVSPNADGVLGFCLSGAPVADTFALNTAYTLYSLNDLTTLGVTADNNPFIYKTVKEFYAESGTGAELWLMAFPDTMKPSEMLDVTQNNATNLINAAKGRLRGILTGFCPDSSYTPAISNGVDADVTNALVNAQALAEWATNTLYAPIFVIVEGYAYTGNPTQLTDLTTLQKNRAGVLIGDTVPNSLNAAIGVLGGRIAMLDVGQNIGRVISGALVASTLYINDKAVELADVSSLDTKGYITFRVFTGRTGYFFNNDHLATSDSDDYSHLTARRTIDKAFRLLYSTYLNLILDDLQVNEDGTIQAAIAKSWETQGEQAIALAMTANGELSSVNGDNGVQILFDTTNNVLAEKVVNISAGVRPLGYADFVNINLGFIL